MTSQSQTIETSTGKVRGRSDSGIHVFKGIPFAQPPVDANRWQVAQPHPGWSGTIEADAFGSMSWQTVSNETGILSFGDNNQPALNEDCLTLNLWTPGLGDKARPVLYWIHGGGFEIGTGASAIYDGTRLATRGDVVVVSINYRLGALGFLNLNNITEGRISASGNEGLTDQVMGLQWVRENVARFGGDPANVTIFGESAGGMSVGSLLAFPQATGLFHKAIPQSGASHTGNTLDKATVIADRVLQKLEIDPKDPGKLLDLPAERIQQLSAQAGAEAGAGMQFQPCVDGDLLPTIPIDAVRAGSADNVSLLVGSTQHEWGLFQNMDPSSEKIDGKDLDRRLSRPGSNGLTHLIEPYRDHLKSVNEPSSEASIFSAIETDRAFRMPAVRLAEVYAARNLDAYMYMFTVRSPAMGGRLGSCHAIDIGYVFGTHNANNESSRFFGGDSEHETLAEVVMDSWIAFAHTGSPRTEALTDWRPYTTDVRSTAMFGTPASVESDPLSELRELWSFPGSDATIGVF